LVHKTVRGSLLEAECYVGIGGQEFAEFITRIPDALLEPS